MSHVTFWWKPGCATNTRQIRLLEAAGCTVTVRDLLSEVWTPERLAGFFGALPVAQWFNPAAPAVKSGAVVPGAFSPEAALLRMVEEPLLIRRPLIEVGGLRRAGFDPGWLALRGVVLTDAEVPQGCSHGEHAHTASCPPPAAVAATHPAAEHATPFALSLSKGIGSERASTGSARTESDKAPG
ncbi:thioredoxin domain-containing protein [Pseudothauera lacus]|uniref:Arsenate reductase family protein n=1 Tax=Pseudothauera lacus TaxID=2136175 RepID=A0A2T4IIU7_9RHOO|nr:arsenate reductase family protein [Pseudothauera lacus]PTD97685.1 arsenate reductase family protein [Pseudothauera lacus]